MANPAGWPPRPHSSIRSIRFYVTASATSLFSDNAFLFASGGAGSANTYTPLPNPGTANTTVIAAQVEPTGTTVVVPSISGTGRADINPQDGSLPPVPMIWSMGIRICNDGTGDLEYSFDGTNIHGRLKQGEIASYPRRHEAGISIRGVAAATPTFRVEAW
jgi:hypothetical protein